MKGGKRPGAGRPPGAKNKATIERETDIAASGETPLDYMLSVMRNPKANKLRRDWAAKAAAPYVHPHLSSVQQQTEMTIEHKESGARQKLNDILTKDDLPDLEGQRPRKIN